MTQSTSSSSLIESVSVIGLGTFGATVARSLAALGHHVIGIDADEQRVNDLADDLTQCVIADARDERALRDAGVDQCDAVLIAMGEDLEANIVGAMNARVLGVSQVWVKSRSRVHRRILMKIGVDQVVNPEQDMGQRIAQSMHNPFVTDYMTASGNLTVVSLNAPESIVGLNLEDVMKSAEIECLGVVRSGTLNRSGTKPVVKTDDILLLLGRRSELHKFGESHCR